MIVAGAGLQLRGPDGSLRAYLSPSPTPYRAAAVNAEELFATANDPDFLSYDLAGQEQARWGPHPDQFAITSMAVTAGTDLYVAASDGKSLHELDRYKMSIGLTPDNGRGSSRIPLLVKEPLLSMDVARSDDCVIVYASGDAKVRYLNFCERTPLPSLATAKPVGAVRIAPEETVLAAPAAAGPIQRLRADGKVVQSYGADVAGGGWTALDLTPDASRFWAGTRDGSLYLFDLASGARVAGPIPAGRITAIAVAGAQRFDPPNPPASNVSETITLDGVPTLTGEGVSGVGPGPQTPPSACTADAPATFTIGIGSPAFPHTIGEAGGPYVGEFTGEATAEIGPQTLAQTSGMFGLPPGPLTKLTGKFAIKRVDADIFGTVASTASTTGTGVCTSFVGRRFNSYLYPPSYPLSGYYRDMSASGLAYEATITRRVRAYTDRGTAALFADQHYVVTAPGNPRGEGIFNGSSNRFHLAFVSKQVSVTDPFADRSAAAAHVAAIPAATPRVQITIHWPHAGDRFDLRGLRLRAAPKRMLAASGKLRPGKLRPGKLRITIKRTSTSLTATVAGLKPGQLDFTVKAAQVSSSTSVETTVGTVAP